MFHIFTETSNGVDAVETFREKKDMLFIVIQIVFGSSYENGAIKTS